MRFWQIALYGSWQAVHRLKMMPHDVGKASTIENVILRACMLYCLILDPPGGSGAARPAERPAGICPTCRTSSRSGNPNKSSPTIMPFNVFGEMGKWRMGYLPKGALFGTLVHRSHSHWLDLHGITVSRRQLSRIMVLAVPCKSRDHVQRASASAAAPRL